jgi:hypothetical protein
MSFSSFIQINKLSIVGLNMRLLQLQNQYLYEGLDRESRNTVMLWESAGIKLREAQLTADQIQQLFAEVEKGATAGGSNRTMLGKGKDAASAVNKAWEDLKTKIQDSKPIKNVDAAYDQAVAKIEAGLGGPDNAVNQVIQKYRKFAKDHPIAQSLIYAALIAAAGISGAGLGGAAVLGLLKMTDKLLQGEKFSSAAYAGGKTGALAYGASKLGDLIKGKPEGGAGAPDHPGSPEEWVKGQNPPPNWIKDPTTGKYFDPADAAGAATDSAAGAIKGSRGLANEAARIFKEKVAGGEITDYNSYQQGMQDALDQALKNAGGQMSFQSQQTAQMILKSKLDSVAAQTAGGQFSGSGPEKVAAVIKGLGGTVNQDSMDKAISAASTMRKTMSGESITRSDKHLSEGQVYLVFNRVCATNDRLLAEGVLKEGPMDFFKGAAAKGMDKLKTVGKNLTTKVTADKLNAAWRKSGSPTDSEELKSFLQSQGVDQTVVNTVYSSLKIKSQPVKSAAGATDKTKAAVPGTGTAQSASTQTLYAQLKKDVMGLNKKEKQRIFAYLQKQLGTV